MSVSVECDLRNADFEGEISAIAHRIFDDRREPWHVTARNEGHSVNVVIENREFNRAANLAGAQKSGSYIESLFLKWVGEYDNKAASQQQRPEPIF